MPAPYDVLIIGAGPGGYVAAIRAAKAAHLPVIAVAWGYAQRPDAEMAPDAVALPMQNIPALVAQLDPAQPRAD